MQCPHCGNYDNRVIKTDLRIKRNIRSRIRICTHCGAKLPTEEKILMKEFRKRNPRKPPRIE